MPSKFIDDGRRAEFDAFLLRLPLALEREDLRAVHACWHQPSIDVARHHSDVRAMFAFYDQQTNEQIAANPNISPLERELLKQNGNPVKVLTSGLETASEKPFELGGKHRCTGRLPWWESYDQEIFTVFGHYWRIPVLGKDGPYPLFDADKLYEPHGRGNSMCIDFSVGGRWFVRANGCLMSEAQLSLAALRWPEGQLWFENAITSIHYIVENNCARLSEAYDEVIAPAKAR